MKNLFLIIAAMAAILACSKGDDNNKGKIVPGYVYSSIYEEVAPGEYKGEVVAEGVTCNAWLTISNGSDIIKVVYDQIAAQTEPVRYEYSLPVKVQDKEIMVITDPYSRTTYRQDADNQWVVAATEEIKNNPNVEMSTRFHLEESKLYSVYHGTVPPRVASLEFSLE